MILLYIDPGAGTMVIQAVLTAVLAIPFFFRAQVGQITPRFRRPASDEEQVER